MPNYAGPLPDYFYFAITYDGTVEDAGGLIRIKPTRPEAKTLDEMGVGKDWFFPDRFEYLGRSGQWVEDPDLFKKTMGENSGDTKPIDEAAAKKLEAKLRAAIDAAK